MTVKIEIPDNVKSLIVSGVPDPVSSVDNHRVVTFLQTLVDSVNALNNATTTTVSATTTTVSATTTTVSATTTTVAG